jgi:hypothetical protein
VKYLTIPVLLFLLAASLVAAAPLESDDQASDELIQRYVAQAQLQQDRLKGVQMDMDIDARLPKLQKTGRMHALRQISRVGQITYQGLKFIGDTTIKNDVIVRYLRAESESRGVNGMAITPDNYKFKYKGLSERNGKQVHVFNVTPRKKMVGLFKGEIWLDPATCMPLRESGHFVKNPSVFLKKVEFVRDYEITNGVAFPKHIESTVDTRFWGKAEMSIDYSNYSNEEQHAEAATTETVGTSR